MDLATFGSRPLTAGKVTELLNSALQPYARIGAPLASDTANPNTSRLEIGVEGNGTYRMPQYNAAGNLTRTAARS